MHLVYTASARERLSSIVSYIGKNESDVRAEMFQQGILDRAEELIQFPLKGHSINSLATLGLEHRGLVHGRHLIIYRVEADAIRVTDFFDTKQHPARMRG